MKKIWVTKEFKFEAAHYLPGYDGPCNNLHGHSYKLAVSIAGPVDEKSGMVLDFTKLKQIVEECIISKLDHSCLNISHVPGFPEDNPTAENMVAWMGELLSVRIEYEYGLRLVFVKLWETETSSAMWMPE